MTVLRRLWTVIRGPVVLDQRDAPINWSTWQPGEDETPQPPVADGRD
jgi:hypothetical protein